MVCSPPATLHLTLHQRLKSSFLIMLPQTPVYVDCHNLIPPMQNLAHHQAYYHSLAFFPHLPMKTLQIHCNINYSPLISNSIWPDSFYTVLHCCWQRLHLNCLPASHLLNHSGVTKSRTVIFWVFFPHFQQTLW